MQELNFPTYNHRIKSRQNKWFIFDPIRKRELLLSPEEWVRQNCLAYLKDMGYPWSLTAVEKELSINSLKKRTDILVYDGNSNPFLLVECKAPSIEINQDTFDQIARYNLALNAKYLMVTNGLNHYYCSLDYQNKRYEFLRELPKFELHG